MKKLERLIHASITNDVNSFSPGNNNENFISTKVWRVYFGQIFQSNKEKTVLLYGKNGRSIDLKETRFDIYNSFSLKFSIVAKNERKIRKENSQAHAIFPICFELVWVEGKFLIEWLCREICH